MPPTPPPGLCLTCTFDNDDCGFYNEQNDKGNWQRKNGATPAWNSGPDDDHSLQNGFGMKIIIKEVIY